MNILDLIGHTKYEISKKKISQPREGFFLGHGGGDFILELKNTEEHDWDNAVKQDSIESYSLYLNNHPCSNSERVTIASKRLEEFRDEVSVLSSVLSLSINEFKKYYPFYDHGIFSEKVSRIIELLKTLSISVSGDKEAQSQWSVIRLSKDKLKFSQFIKDFPDSSYAKLAIKIKETLENQEKEEEAWTQSQTSKNTATLNRIGRLKIYIEEFPYGKYLNKAYNLIEDMSAFHKIETEKDNDVKTTLIQEYFKNQNYQEYNSKAKKMLDDINWGNKIELLGKELLDYISENNFEKIQDFQEFLLGHKEEEIDKLKELIVLTENYLRERIEKIDAEALSAIESEDPQQLQRFMSQYPASEPFIRVKSKFDSLDIEIWSFVKENMNVFELGEYIHKFQGTEAAFLNDAKDFLVELKHFESCNTLDSYKAHIERYGEAGLKYDESLLKIRDLSLQAKIQEDYQQLKNNGSMSKFEEFLQQYGFETEFSDEVVSLLNTTRAKNQKDEILNKIAVTKGEEVLNIIADEIENVNEEFRLELKDLEIVVRKEKENIQKFMNMLDAEDIEGILSLKNETFKYSYFDAPSFEDAIAFLKILVTKDINLMEKFIQSNNGNKFIERLKLEKDALITADRNTEDQYEAFLNKYPDSKYDSNFISALSELREIMKDKIEFEELIKDLSEIKLVEYIKKESFKNEEHVRIAKHELIRLKEERVEEKLYEEILNQKSEKLCLKYLSDYEKGRYIQDVKRILVELLNPIAETKLPILTKTSKNYWKYATYVIGFTLIALLIFMLYLMF